MRVHGAAEYDRGTLFSTNHFCHSNMHARVLVACFVSLPPPTRSSLTLPPLRPHLANQTRTYTTTILAFTPTVSR